MFGTTHIRALTRNPSIPPMQENHTPPVSLAGQTWSIGIVGSIWGFPKIRGTILGVPIIRTIVFGGLYWVPLFWESTIFVCCNPIPWRNLCNTGPTLVRSWFY